MILVLGSTGNIGGEVARQLIAQGIRPRLLVRNPEKAKAFADKAEIVKGDLADPQSLGPALRGIEHVFLVSNGVDGQQQERAFIDEAKKAGVRHIVKLSVIGADDPKLSFSQWHAATEKHLQASGIGWTFVRPGNFMTNAFGWADTIKSGSNFYSPTGTGKWADIDPADIGAVAVTALTQPGHEGKAYTITGPQSLDAAGHAEILSKVLGKKVTAVDVPMAAAKDAMLKGGYPPVYVDALVNLLEAMKAGQTDYANEVVREVTGRPAGTFEQWVRKNQKAFA